MRASSLSVGGVSDPQYGVADDRLGENSRPIAALYYSDGGLADSRTRAWLSRPSPS